MITHAASVTIFVRDQDAALAFYTDKLGFKVREDSPMGEGLRWLTVAPPGAETAIVLAMGYGGYDESRIGQFAGIVWATEDIQATYAELHGRGVPFTEPPSLQPWGMWQALFVDMDGNGFVLVQRARGTGSDAIEAYVDPETSGN
jgi:catechol 2,3-dioxygenase-like lactoylglutathione lyase family enzyme